MILQVAAARQKRIWYRLSKPTPELPLQKTRTPRRRNKREEFEQQKQLIRMVGFHEKRYPELALLQASAAGEVRDDRTGAKLKAMGLRPGFTDLVLHVPRGIYHALHIEMKSTKGHVSDEQKRVHALLERYGNKVAVCRSAGEAWTVLVDYINTPPGVTA
jgi:hypothetical protein